MIKFRRPAEAHPQFRNSEVAQEQFAQEPRRHLDVRPYFQQILIELLHCQRKRKCRLGFFAPWDSNHMHSTVQVLLEEPTKAPWEISGVTARGVKKPWAGPSPGVGTRDHYQFT